MSRISLAFRSFFGILFGGELAADIAGAYGYVKPPKEKPAPPAPVFTPRDGALQMLGVLQRDARLVDFLMEDISGFEDDQVGAAVRDMHKLCRDTLTRYVQLGPVIDGVEGAYAKAEGAVKFVGNVPAGPPPKGGTLRHRGWKAVKTDLPALNAKQDVAVIAPAEIEIE